MNLKQNELLQLIAAQCRDLNQLIEGRMHHGAYVGEAHRGDERSVASNIRERVRRIEQLSSELE